MSDAQERSCIRKWRRTKQETLLQQVVMNNLRQAVLYARRVCQDKFDDGELISLCYQTLMKKARRYNPGSELNFFTFAKIGVRGVVNRNFRQLDTIRHAKRVYVHDLEEGGGSLPQQCDHGNSATLVSNKDEAEYICRVIRRCCSEREQVIFALTYYGCLGFNEIAKLLGVSRSAIQAAHARALEKVRSEYRLSERLLSV